MRSMQWTASLLIGLAVFGGTGCFSLTGKDPTLRTPGRLLDDQMLERVAAQRIDQADERLASSHINVTSYDGIVLLTGQVETDALRDRAERAIADLRRIQKIHNQIEVGSPISLVARTNDNWLSTKVVSRFIASDEVDASRIKVVVENGVAYLMGVVPRTQGNAAAQAASTVFGVGKVVKVFDYL